MTDLEHLCKAYFHQSWSTEYSCWELALDDFLTRSPDRASGALADIDTVLGESAGGADVSRALHDLGCEFLPAEGDRAWLQAVRAHIAAALARRNHPLTLRPPEVGPGTCVD